MMKPGPSLFTLSKQSSALLLIDVQEKLFPHVEHTCEVMHTLLKVIKGWKILGLPIYVTEQYPQGLGSTVPILKNLLGNVAGYFIKTSFSCLDDPQIRKALIQSPITDYVLVGLEAHVCVLQTAKDLFSEGKRVVVLNDAISSRSIYDFSTAIAELRDCGIRVSSSETILFELLRNSQVPEFKKMSQLLKNMISIEA